MRIACKSISTCVGIALIGLMAVSACSKQQPLESLDVGSNPDLAAHTKEFKQEVIEVTDGVYVAVGFGLANSILLDGLTPGTNYKLVVRTITEPHSGNQSQVTSEDSEIVTFSTLP